MLHLDRCGHAGGQQDLGSEQVLLIKAEWLCEQILSPQHD